MNHKQLSAIFTVLIIYVSTYLNSVFAQENQKFKLTGTFTSQSTISLDDVTVQLLKATDNSLVKLEFVNKDGSFKFENIPSGTYLLVTQSLVFTKYQSNQINLTEDLDLGKINLEVINNQLKEVTVTATKPLIQQQYDKTVVNVSNSITSVGSNALEVLQKAPGITLDQNDNIAMRGRQGVLVMIDGKLVPMSGQDLANMLKTMSSNEIDRIDLITNPSAKYDAAGNSGIIDIHLKKGTKSGINGSATLSFGYGKYSKFNPSLNLNAKGKKLNNFISYSYGNNNNFNKLDIIRNFYDSNNQNTGGNNYNNYFKFGFNNHNLRLGTDFTVNKNIVIGTVLTGNFSSGNINSDSRAQSFNASKQSTGYFNTGGDNHPNRNNKSINVNYRQNLDSLGSELSADFDYAKFGSDEIQNYQTLYFDANRQPSANPYQLLGDLSGDLSIKSFKIDYTKPIKKWGMKLEAGVKSSWVTSDNDVKFYDKSSGTEVLDQGKSNHFIYNENINAAYLNTSKSWSKLSLQFGLRVENTVSDGLQIIDQTTFDRNYTQFFPSGYVGYKFSKDHNLGVSLSKRINRPSYRQLNPFKVFLDPLTYSVGNPYLKPELTNSFELNYTFKEKYNAKLSYSQTSDNILVVLSPDTQPNSVIQTGRNLAKYDYYSFSFNFPVAISKWLNSNNNALAYYGAYKGYLVNTNLNTSRVAYNFNSSNSIIINKTTNAEINFNYQSKDYYGFLDINSNWNLSLGLQKNVWSKKGTFKLNVNDIFYTNKVTATTRLSGYGEDFFQSRDSRFATLAFTYKFGKPIQNNRKRTGSAEEEKSRAN